MDQLIVDLPEKLLASFEAHTLFFRKPSGTSRGILTEKKLWLLTILSEDTNITGIGECSVIAGLSPDYSTDSEYEAQLQTVCSDPLLYLRNPDLLKNAPSIQFGLETAFLDWKNGGKAHFFHSDFTKGIKSIPINGLIWMGDEMFMQEQITQKLTEGFSCIKMKVGAIEFDKELRLLESIRKQFSAEQITLRVDANGAFSPKEAPEKLQQLADLAIHSIEQPIAAGQHAAMRQLCSVTPLPIALDEELIPVVSYKERREMLHFIQPQYIILKPSLHGGFSGCLEWIKLANELSIPWWITSALESNIGLNAIAQFTATFDPVIPQGLGTGGLYQTNFESPLFIQNGALYYQPEFEDYPNVGHKES